MSSNWEFRQAIPLFNKGLLVNDNWGEIPRIARYTYKFINSETFENVFVTDLELYRQKRNRKFVEFYNKYEGYLKSGTCTLFACVADIDKWKSGKNYIDYFKNKLKKQKVSILGYISLRDIGDYRFKTHFHFLIITSKVKDKQSVNEVIESEENNDSSAQIRKDFKRMVRYLIAKEVYCPNKKRSYSVSRIFKSPNAN